MRPLPPIPDWIKLEHQVANILTQQEIHGWYFDEKAARELESALRREYEETCAVLRKRFPYVEGPRFTPKRSNKTRGYFPGTGVVNTEGVEECSLTKLKELNPTSRDHISWILQTHYGWTPSSMTSKEKPVIDETVLKDIGMDIPVALDFLRLLDLKKQLGMISEGVNAWQKLVTKSSRIHHHCSVATSTFRCAHRKPNLAQVPSDERFRSLFKASPGMVMVGADLSGIELRMLAHYLAPFDKGRYADILVNGDIHQTNADKIGISRSQVKTVTYAFLYGAGDTKIGHSYDKQLSDEKAEKKGKEIRKAYIDAIPGLKKLLDKVRKVCEERSFLYGLDHRRIIVKSRHKSLNYLLQGSAAVVAKKWMALVHENIFKDVHQLAFVHDELQFECPVGIMDQVEFLLEWCAVSAGEFYKMKCPVAAEAKSGITWAEVH